MTEQYGPPIPVNGVRRKDICSIEMLNRLLIADFDAGVMYWRPHPDRMQVAGKEAFTYTNELGYRVGRLCARQVKAHRVLWAMKHGRWPLQVDHINGDRADNRIHNLRETDQFTNMQNARRRRDSASGYTGIHKAGNRWAARITRNKVTHNLGVFETLDLAIAARLQAQTQMGFGPSHGR